MLLPLLLAVAQAPTPPPQPSTLPDPPTWSNGVGALVHRSCTDCHRPGQAGPFHLLTYEDARKRAPMLAEVVEQRYMPPWHPVEGHGTFLDPLRLSDEEVASLVAWADAGAPEGDPDQAPAPPTYPEEGWTLGEPDLVVQMTEGFDVPAGGPDIYHNFVVPLPLDEDVWVAAIEVQPGAPRVLHHVLYSVDTSGRGRQLDERDPRVGFGGVDAGNIRGRRSLGDGVSATGLDGVGLGGWAVGGRPYRLPLGLARRVPAGADLILRSHFHPSGKAETEVTTLGLYFAEAPPTRSLHALQLPPEFGAYERLVMQPGERRVALQDTFTLPVDCLAISVGGHAHFLCETMQLWATPPGEERRSIFRIGDWDFDWQQRYVYAEPVLLAKGTRVAARVTYDNSDANPDNPHSPPRRVRWGLQSTDEMGSLTLALVPAQESDAADLAKALNTHHYRRGPGVTLRPQLAEDVLRKDTDADGRVALSAFRGREKRIAEFSDFDGDGYLDRQELFLDEDRARPLRTGAPPEPVAPGAEALELSDCDGGAHQPLALGNARATVLIFVTTDCPIANAFAPDINALVDEFSSLETPFSIVQVDPSLDAAGARAHAGEYGFRVPVLLDPEQRLCALLGVTRTPEAAIVGRSGELLYRGRISDLYTDLGRRRQAASSHDLRRALKEILADEPVSQPRTQPVGCLLPAR